MNKISITFTFSRFLQRAKRTGGEKKIFLTPRKKSRAVRRLPFFSKEPTSYFFFPAPKEEEILALKSFLSSSSPLSSFHISPPFLPPSLSNMYTFKGGGRRGQEVFSPSGPEGGRKEEEEEKEEKVHSKGKSCRKTFMSS